MCALLLLFLLFHPLLLLLERFRRRGTQHLIDDIVRPGLFLVFLILRVALLGFRGAFELGDDDGGLCNREEQQRGQRTQQQSGAEQIVAQLGGPAFLHDLERAAAEGGQLVLRGGVVLHIGQRVAVDLVAGGVQQWIEPCERALRCARRVQLHDTARAPYPVWAWRWSPAISGGHKPSTS